MRTSTWYSMGLLALSMAVGVAGCGDDDDDGNDTTAGSAGKGGNATAGKGGNTAAGKGGNTTAGKGGNNGGGGDDGNAGENNGGTAPVGGETSGGSGGASGSDTGGANGEGGGAGETQAAADLNVNGAGYLTDSAGFVLYTRDGDTVSATDPDSTCAAGCPGWPAFAAENPTVSGGLDVSDFLFFDGSLGDQTAYKGAPLYNFVGDGSPGQINGNAGIWHAVKIVP